MKKVIRIYRYARQHVEEAERMLEDLIIIRKELNNRIENVDDIYTSALTNGDVYVPIYFMHKNHEFNRYRVRMEEKQKQVVMNLAFSLSFCSELVSLKANDQESEAFNFKVRVRNVIEKVIMVANDEAMNTASLTSLVPAVAKMESDIVLCDADYLGLIKRRLLEFRTRIS